MSSDMPSVADFVAVFSQPLPDLAGTSFTAIETGIPGVTAEYMEHGPKMKLHFFAEKGFPAGFGDALKNTGMEGSLAEYVPEAKSWYFEYGLSQTMPADVVLQLFMKKLAGLVKNAQGNG